MQKIKKLNLHAEHYWVTHTQMYSHKIWNKPMHAEIYLSRAEIKCSFHRLMESKVEVRLSKECQAHAEGRAWLAVSEFWVVRVFASLSK